MEIWITMIWYWKEFQWNQNQKKNKDLVKASSKEIKEYKEELEKQHKNEIEKLTKDTIQKVSTKFNIFMNDAC